MTDSELNTAIAEKVFGITEYARNYLNWEGIGLIAKAMCEKGWWMRLDAPFSLYGEYWAGFTPLGTTGWNGRPDHKASHTDAPHAVALAALKALEAK